MKYLSTPREGYWQELDLGWPQSSQMGLCRERCSRSFHRIHTAQKDSLDMESYRSRGRSCRQVRSQNTSSSSPGRQQMHIVPCSRQSTGQPTDSRMLLERRRQHSVFGAACINSLPASLSEPVLKEAHNDWETALAAGTLMAKRTKSMVQIQVVETRRAIERATRK